MAEEDPWGFDEGDTDFTPTSKVTSRAGTPSSAKVAGGSMAGGSLAGDVAADARPVMDSADEGNYRKPLTLNKHWVRCVHLLCVILWSFDVMTVDGS